MLGGGLPARGLATHAQRECRFRQADELGAVPRGVPAQRFARGGDDAAHVRRATVRRVAQQQAELRHRRLEAKVGGWGIARLRRHLSMNAHLVSNYGERLIDAIDQVRMDAGLGRHGLDACPHAEAVRVAADDTDGNIAQPHRLQDRRTRGGRAGDR